MFGNKCKYLEEIREFLGTKYVCGINKKKVEDVTASNVCKNGNHRDCEHYKKAGGGGIFG